jgi:uracil-DNA glycosylase
MGASASRHVTVQPELRPPTRAVASLSGLRLPIGQIQDMKTFEAACEDCPRLSAFLAEVRRRHPDYHARPVPPFGASRPRLLVVGLAPGLHGANRTGRPFTGDYAGILLYATLYRFGFANRPVAEHAADGLELIDCRITNAVKCLPPAEQADARRNQMLQQVLGVRTSSAG